MSPWAFYFLGVSELFDWWRCRAAPYTRQWAFYFLVDLRGGLRTLRLVVAL